VTAVPPPAPAGAAEVFGPGFDLAVRYARLLCRDGVDHGLIGPREAERVWQRHLLNSAAVAPLLGADAVVVDVGSGAGLPGIPLVLARPDLRMTLVEPMQRRVAFLQRCVAELGLPVDVVRARADELPSASADAVVARAVAPLTRLVPACLHVLRRRGTLLAMKGRNAEAEMEEVGSVLNHWPDARMRLVEVSAAGESARVVLVTRGEAPATS
jgi:16S rRNA (guanine527-N7)-methyltransferase